MNSWITTKEFQPLSPIPLYHKQLDKSFEIKESAYFNKHILFRKNLNVTKLRGKYTLDITADDYYKLYINGRFVGQGPAPSYHFSYYYNTFDITDFLTEGENIIAVHCYYQGLINRVWQSGDNRMGLYARIFCDGVSITETDETWKYAYDESFEENAPAIGYRTQFIENIDMRKAQYGWKKPSFDDSKWENALIKEDDDHIIKKSYIPPVSVYTKKWVTAEKISENEYLFDFGKETVGGLRLEISGTEGNTAEIMCAEEPGENGLPRYEMRCNVTYKEKWTFSGKRDFIENFDYKAFRYVLVRTDEPSFSPEMLTAVVRHYPVTHKFNFKTENEALQKVWDICENAVIMASQESFLDCPSREKGQYTGDLTVTAISHFYITGDSRLYKKALFDIADSARICEGLMAVTSCSFMQEFADYSLLYPYQLLKYYELSGDRDTLEKLLPVAENMLSFFKKYERADGLLESVAEPNLVDWPVNLRDNYDFNLDTPVKGTHAVINAFYYGALKATDKIRGILGKETSKHHEKIRESFFRAFRDEKTGLIRDSEISNHSSLHSNALPLFFSMLEEEKAAPVVSLVKEKGLCCGVYFAYFVLKGLIYYGEKDYAVSLITADTENSWVNMINEGATACFEAWGKDRKRNTSLCHPWASTPIIIISEDILEKGK